MISHPIELYVCAAYGAFGEWEQRALPHVCSRQLEHGDVPRLKTPRRYPQLAGRTRNRQQSGGREGHPAPGVCIVHEMHYQKKTIGSKRMDAEVYRLAAQRSGWLGLELVIAFV